MKTYKIICRTNGYQASRNIMFEGVYCGGSSATVVLKENLSLKEAKEKLVEFYNKDYSNNLSVYADLPYIMRWGNGYKCGGTYHGVGIMYGYEYDGYHYEIEEDVEE